LRDAAANALITASPVTDAVVTAAKQAGITRVFETQQLTHISSVDQGLVGQLHVEDRLKTPETVATAERPLRPATSSACDSRKLDGSATSFGLESPEQEIGACPRFDVNNP
jgi:hypothetical protein